MSETSDARGSASRSRRRQPVSARNRQYMIAPAGLGVTRQTLVDRLNKFENIEILRTYAERENICPPIAVVRAPDAAAAVLRRSAAAAVVFEPVACITSPWNHCRCPRRWIGAAARCGSINSPLNVAAAEARSR